MFDVKIYKPRKDGELKLIKIIPARKLELRYTKKHFSLNRKSPMQKPINDYDPNVG